MAFIVESFHRKKLKDLNIKIDTSYIVGNNIVKRSDSNNIDIKSGIRCLKEYYHNNELKHIENEFDSRIEYTFLSSDLNNKNKCPNCGMDYLINNDELNCPYCGTYYNIDYIDKDLGSKYHYDKVLKSNLYRIITGIVDLIISLIISFVYLKYTSRTFNFYDVSKVVVYGVILSFILYYFFYLIDAYIVIGPIKRYKENTNRKQKEFWNRTKIDKKTFFNNLNIELRKYYYSMNNVVDYDILDYLNFYEENEDNKFYVNVYLEVRVVSFENNKFISKYQKESFKLRQIDNGNSLKAGANVINCYNCGASIDVLKNKCEYCDSDVKYFQEWILDKK